MTYEVHTLKNGFRIILAESPGAESATVMMMSGTGSRYESEQENGMAHFLEHMVFKGTKHRKNAKVIAEELDRVGGQFNAFTAKDHTAYYAKVDKRHVDTALAVVSDIFLNPTFPKAEIERERGTVVEEINMYEDMPIRSVLDEFDMTIFGNNTPLGRTILGPKRNIKSFTRAQFTDYFARNYVAGNSVLVVSGAFGKTKVLKEAKKLFGTMREGVVPTHESHICEQDAPRVHIKHKKTDQTHLVLGVSAYPFGHADEPVLHVLAAILGGGMSSRLFTQVRERRGLAYYVKADSDRYDDAGVFYMRAGVANEKLADALTTILAEVRKMKKTKLTDAELSKAKEYVKGTKALALDTTDAVAEYVGYAVLVRDEKRDIRAFNRAIDAVTNSDVQRVARELFTTDALNLAVVGPHKDTQTLETLLSV